MVIILLSFCLLLAGFSLGPRAIALDDEKDWKLENIGKDEAILFSDSGFNYPAMNFSPGQMVYVRVTAGRGDKQKTLRLLDGEKKELKRLTFKQEGNIYTISFAAPAPAGLYYVDIKIEGEGSSYAHQENLTVGKAQGGSLTAQAESEMVTGGKGQSYRLEILQTPAPVIIPSPPADFPPSQNQAMRVVSQILEFLKNFLRRFFT